MRDAATLAQGLGIGGIELHGGQVRHQAVCRQQQGVALAGVERFQFGKRMRLFQLESAANRYASAR